MKRLLFDTCFLKALYTPTDQYNRQAKEIWEMICRAESKILIPYPVLYETLKTEFVKNKTGMEYFNRLIRKCERVELVCDSLYRKDALFDTLNIGSNQKVSMVDRILILMAEKRELNINGIVSFDVRDLSEYCRKRNILFVNSKGYL